MSISEIVILIIFIIILYIATITLISLFLSNKHKQHIKLLELEYEHKVQEKLKSLQEDLFKDFDQKKRKSADVARTVMRGQLLQQFVPFTTTNYNPFDFRFMGDFCDYIIVDGYTQVKDSNGGKVNKVVFVEVKTGDASLSKHQRAVRSAIQEGRVEWLEVRPELKI